MPIGNYDVEIRVSPHTQWVGTWGKSFSFKCVAPPEDVKKLLEFFDKHIKEKLDLEIEEG